MDDRQQKQAMAKRLAPRLVGKTKEFAQRQCEQFGLTLRYISIDGKACITTRDIRVDRISARVVNDSITEADVG